MFHSRSPRRQDHWDPEAAGQYGEKGNGQCGRNYFPDRYLYASATKRLEEWVRDGTVAPSAPRWTRNATTGRIMKDAHLNAVGGLRLPPIDVPVATYTTDGCPPLTGATIAFDPVSLQSMYAGGKYVPMMQAATHAAVAKGYLLPDDAADLMRRARASSMAKL